MHVAQKMPLKLVSLPVRGAWIEIERILHVSDAILSLPVRGAWIEMSMRY